MSKLQYVMRSISAFSKIWITEFFILRISFVRTERQTDRQTKKSSIVWRKQASRQHSNDCRLAANIFNKTVGEKTCGMYITKITKISQISTRWNKRLQHQAADLLILWYNTQAIDLSPYSEVLTRWFVNEIPQTNPGICKSPDWPRVFQKSPDKFAGVNKVTNKKVE